MKTTQVDNTQRISFIQRENISKNHIPNQITHRG